MADSVVLSLSRDSDSAIREELERVLCSRTFVNSHRIRRFLQFVVEEYLAGRQHRLKEYPIGLEVFGRPESFDPRVDSIVRVEARRLRAKLDEYYAGDGADSALCIQLRKGSYVPLIEAGLMTRRRQGGAGHPRWRRPSVGLNAFTANNGDADLLQGVHRRLAQHLSAQPSLRVVMSGAADYMLEGEFDSADEPKLFLRLIDTADRSLVWSREFDWAAPDLGFCELAARSIWGAIAGVRAELDGSRHRGNHDSQLSYLQGLRSWTGSRHDSGASTEYFRKAVEADPDHAAAWAALAETLVVGSLLEGGDGSEVHARALDAAGKAVELDDALPESRRALAAVRSFFEWRWEEGEREFERAILLDPANSASRLLYGVHLACRGKLGLAEAELYESERLAPVSLAVHLALGWVHSLQSSHEEAVRRYRLVALLEPDSPWSYLGLGQTCAAQQKWTEAIAHLSNASSLLSGRFLFNGLLGFCYAKAGRKQEAYQLLRRLPEMAAPAAMFASIYLGLEEPQRAFSCLQQGAATHESSLPPLLLGPEFDRVRDEPQFRALQAVIGLGIPVASAA